MYLRELKGEGHMSPSWMGSDLDHYTYKKLFTPRTNQLT